MLCSGLFRRYRIVGPEEDEWRYDYEVKRLNRNDTHWQRLFASSNNNTFNIENLWSLFSEEGNKEMVKKNKVDAHATRCRRCESVSCVDCSVSFWGGKFN